MPIFTCLYARDQRLGHARRDAALQEQPARGGAALAGRADGAEQHRAQRQIGIGVVHHDDAVVAAQLQNGAAQPARDHFGDVPAHLRWSR